MAELPIQLIRQQILEKVKSGNRLVLSAPTGSGKTTQVPQILLSAKLKERQIIVLQPRRLAARLVAQRVAGEMKTAVGEVVGYQTRHESKVSSATVIRFMTEGLFLRMIQSRPDLPGVGAVILDEFHERNLASDLALALVKRLQEERRADLKLIVMSATLDVDLVAKYLAAQVLEAHGRAYPVEIRYLDKRPARKEVVGKIRWGRSDVVPVWELAAEAAHDAVDEEKEGDVLIFMPGVYEIRRTLELLPREDGAGRKLALYGLHSQMTPREQDEAIAPSSSRKIIVSTNVAETSITIEGVRHVIDCGLARVNRFDPRRGLNALLIEPISRASAEQRAGRAGRTAAGSCMRLWTQAEDRHRAAQSTPEIQRLDLAEAMLSLYAMEVGNPREFPWLERPTAEAVGLAQRTLAMLGAVVGCASAHRDAPGVLKHTLHEKDGAITKVGRQMALLPMHPRLSRMLVEAGERKCLRRACLWAALISEREIFLPNAKNNFADEIPAALRSDFLVLERAMEVAGQMQFDVGKCASRGLNAQACREVQRTWQLFLATAKSAGLLVGASEDVAEVVRCLVLAFPDHLAVRRNATNLACALTGGRRGQLDGQSVAQHVGILLPIEITEIGAGSAAKTVLSMVSEIDLKWVYEVLGEKVVREKVVEFNSETKAVEAVERDVIDGLVIWESPAREPEKSAAAGILAEQVVAGNLKLEKWDEEVEQWIARTRCVGKWFAEKRLIGYSEEERRMIIEEICAGATRYKEIADKPCLAFVKDALSWEDQQLVEQMAPDRIALPRGWKMKVVYDVNSPPRGRAKIQDLYGLEQTPTVAGGRQKVLLEILGPNMRPLQLTDDLGNFWKNLYPVLKKELSRKYPRHEWR